jgi:predicted RNA-binding Zn-ribbon protein involved in translation (DUF1610 family)
MRWIFKEKFSKKVGQDYIYECDNCGKRIKVKDIKDIPTKKTGMFKGRHYCPHCKEIEDWRR